MNGRNFSAKKILFSCLCILALAVLPACRAGPNPSTGTAAPPAATTPAASPTSTSPVPETSTPAPTLVLASGGDAGAQAAPLLEDGITPAPDPLRFTFPNAGPAPVSAWRPPQYPIPWALSPYDHFYFARPIAADEVNWPEWDYRYGGNVFGDSIHTGIDISAPKGTPVLAAGSGKVIWAGYGLYRGYYDPRDPYGDAVVIRHEFGYQGQRLYTVYGHLDRVDVADGEYVKIGQVLGLSGETGQTTGPHLHFEVRLAGNDFFTTRNPELWLVPPQGWGVMAGRVMDTGGNLLPTMQIILTARETHQNWIARSYGLAAVNSDPYYNENLVISDLPAGDYTLRIPYVGFTFTTTIQIYPGVVSYFTFQGRYGMNTALPPTPAAGVTPVP